MANHHRDHYRNVWRLHCRRGGGRVLGQLWADVDMRTRRQTSANPYFTPRQTRSYLARLWKTHSQIQQLGWAMQSTNQKNINKNNPARTERMQNLKVKLDELLA